MPSELSRNIRAVLCAILCSILGLGVSVATETEAGMLYYVRDGKLVLTNTPTQVTKPVPGFNAMKARTGTVSSRKRQPRTKFDGQIDAVAGETGVASELIKAVARVESAFNPRAVSHKGAQGLMQLMPATAKHYGVTDPFDPYQNLRAGATHLNELLREFGGDLDLALAAYNAGSGAVRRYGGIPNYTETRNYVRKVREALTGEPQPLPAARRRVTPAKPARMVVQADGSVVMKN